MARLSNLHGKAFFPDKVLWGFGEPLERLARKDYLVPCTVFPAFV